MDSYFARIERANGKLLDHIQIRVTVDEARSGRHPWSGDFMSRSADGFQPSERFWLTLSNGQKGTASVSRTHFDSRTPDATLVEFTGAGPLS